MAEVIVYAECSGCSDWEECLNRKQEDGGRREFHCSNCGKDVVVTEVAPCRSGIHFCYERAVEIMGLSGIIPGRPGQPDYDRYWKDKDPVEYLKGVGW